MEDIKIGDFVYFSLSNPNDEKLFINSGLVIDVVDDKVSILNASYNHSIYTRDKDYVRPISDKEDIIKEINTFYDKQIERYRSQLLSIKRMDYRDEIKNKYYKLKEEIINTCKNMIDLNAEDDTEFENKLKAICQKKKQLFTIECEGMNQARKHNGEIKYNINEINKRRNSDINNLDKSIDNLKRILNK